MKSFAELHTLWYLCLRERNTFATVKEERKRWNIHKRMTQMDVGRADKAVRRCAVFRSSLQPPNHSRTCLVWGLLRCTS